MLLGNPHNCSLVSSGLDSSVKYFLPTYDNTFKSNIPSFLWNNYASICCVHANTMLLVFIQYLHIHSSQMGHHYFRNSPT